MSKTNRKDFEEMLQRARRGADKPLNDFFVRLFEQGRNQLLRYARSEEQAREYFQEAVVRFWEKFVVREDPLPESNIEGYIFQMARFSLYSQHRSEKQNPTLSKEELNPGTLEEKVEELRTAVDHYEEQRAEDCTSQAVRTALEQLDDDKCRQLYQAMYREGEKKNARLVSLLGWKDSREVAVEKYRCRPRFNALYLTLLEECITKA